MVVNRGGDNFYEAQDVAQGSALAGVGIVVDYGPNNRYRGVRRVQGQAIGGVGILLGRGGKNDYHAAMWAQGFGGPLGFGLLDNVTGNNHYYCGGMWRDSYPETPGYEGWGQGVGAGIRQVADGGVGVILDGGGENTYEFDYLSHGGGYWCGLGFARDFGGNTKRLITRTAFDGGPRQQPSFQRFGCGWGCHYAMGFLFDDSGDDVYEGTIMGTGMAWDCSMGVLCDFAGNDHYTATGGLTQGTGAQMGFGILFDYRGDDVYEGYGQGYASPSISYHDLPACGGNFSFLIDYGGKDQVRLRRREQYLHSARRRGRLFDRSAAARGDGAHGQGPAQARHCPAVAALVRARERRDAATKINDAFTRPKGSNSMTRYLFRLLPLGILATSLLLAVWHALPRRRRIDRARDAIACRAGANRRKTAKPAAAAEEPRSTAATPARQAQARADARAGGLPRPRPGRPRSAPSGWVQHPRQHGHRDHELSASAYGCGTAIAQQTADGNQPVNGITCLCWNYPCDGFQVLIGQQGRVAARIGYGYQEHPGEFLAMLAMSRVPADYTLHVGPNVPKVCGPGRDGKTRLAGAAAICRWCSSAWPTTPTESTWKNDLGETWSIERIVAEESSQPVVGAAEGGMNRLLGLGYAVSRRARARRSDGRALGAGAEIHRRLPGLRSSRRRTPTAVGGPISFPPAASPRMPPRSCGATGRVLEWLAVSLPEKRLDGVRASRPPWTT